MQGFLAWRDPNKNINVKIQKKTSVFDFEDFEDDEEQQNPEEAKLEGIEAVYDLIEQ